jgi:hypothetical protein
VVDTVAALNRVPYTLFTNVSECELYLKLAQGRNVTRSTHHGADLLTAFDELADQSEPDEAACAGYERRHLRKDCEELAKCAGQTHEATQVVDLTQMLVAVRDKLAKDRLDRPLWKAVLTWLDPERLPVEAVEVGQRVLADII